MLSGTPLYADNTHNPPTGVTEWQSWFGDVGSSYVVSDTCWAVIPVSSLTFAPFVCRGYVRSTVGYLSYASQAAVAGLGPFNEGDGTYFTALHDNRALPVSGWHRQPLTHFLWKKSATQPADPSNGVVFGAVLVSGGVITDYARVARESLYVNLASFVPPGVRCTGTGNDTLSLQLALNAASIINKRIELPEGKRCRVTGLLYKGGIGTGLSFGGQTQPGLGLSGSTLEYIGPAGGTVLEVRGGFNVRLKNFAVDGGALAKHAIHVRSNQGAGGVGVSRAHLEHIIIGGVTGAESVGVLLGESLGEPGYQDDSIYLNDVFVNGFTGSAGATKICIATGTFNAKAYTFNNIAASYCQYGVVHGWTGAGFGGGGGHMVLIGPNFGGNTEYDVYNAGGQLSVVGGNSEGSNRLLGGVGFINSASVKDFFWSGVIPNVTTTNVGGTTVANATSNIVGAGTTFTTDFVLDDHIALSSASTIFCPVVAIKDDTHLTLKPGCVLGDGTSQTLNRNRGDDYGINFQGSLILENGTYNNGRGINPNVGFIAPFKIKSATRAVPMTTSVVQSTVMSRGNTFWNSPTDAPDFIPVYDNSNVPVLRPTGIQQQVAVYSQGDMYFDTIPFQLRYLAPVIGQNPIFPGKRLYPLGGFGQPGMTELQNGPDVYAVRLDKEFFTDASTTQTRYIAFPKVIVRGVYTNTTTAFAGLAGSIGLKVTNVAGAEFIQLHDVKTAPVQKGLVDGDLGVLLARATAVQGGYANLESPGDALTVTLESGTGDLGDGAGNTNLTAGSVIIYVFYAALPE